MKAIEKAQAMAKDLSKDYPSLYEYTELSYGPLKHCNGLKGVDDKSIDDLLKDYAIEFYFVYWKYILFDRPEKIDLILDVQDRLKPETTRIVDGVVIMWFD